MKSLRIIVVSLFLLGIFQHGDTCGPDYTPTPRFIFNPSITGTSNLSEYWYDPSSYLNNVVMPDTAIDPTEVWQKSVINDWIMYTQHSITYEELYSEIFGENKNKKLYNWLKNKTGGQEYYNLMMQTSSILTEKSGWNDVAWTYKTAQNQYGIELNAGIIKDLDDNYKNLQSKPIDGFLMQRCAYQRLKIYHYTNQVFEAKNVFETYFSKAEKNWFYYSALFYYSLSFEGMEEAKLLLNCVRNCIDKKNRILYIFDLELYDSLLKEPLTMEMRNDLIALRTIRNPDMNTLEAVKNIAQTEPNHPLLALLITRELSKLEHAALNYSNIFVGEDYASYKKYKRPEYRNPIMIAQYYEKIRSMSTGLKSLLREIKTATQNKPPIWVRVVDAYTTVLEGNHNEFLEEFAEIRKENLSVQEDLQLRAIELVSYGFKGELHGDVFENKAISFFKDLNEAKSFPFQPSMASAVVVHLGWMYHAHGDFEYGTLMRRIPSYNYQYLEVDDLDMAESEKNYTRILDIISNPEKHKFVHYMLHNNFEHLDIQSTDNKELMRDVYTSNMRWFLRRGMHKECSEIYTSLLQISEQEIMIRNPFFVNFAGTYGWTDFEGEQITLSHFFTIMRALEQKLLTAKNNEYSKMALLMGNAYLSMTNNGANSQLMYSYSTEYPAFYNYPEDITGYVTAKIAAEYFDKAWKNCTDENLAAVILIQKGSCKIKNDDFISISVEEWNLLLYDYKSRPNPYYSDYKSRFGSGKKLDIFTSNCNNIRTMYRNLERYTRLQK